MLRSLGSADLLRLPVARGKPERLERPVGYHLTRRIRGYQVVGRRHGGSRGAAVVGSAIVALVFAGCSGGTESAQSPVDALHSAIHALLKSPNYTLATTTTPAPQGLSPTDTVVIQNPDRIAIDADRIVIASTGYAKGPGDTWTSYQHASLATNFMNTSLVYIHMLDRTTQAQENGKVYLIPPDEAASLVRSTGLTWLRGASGVSLSATVDSGVLMSLTLTTVSPPLTIANRVSRVGSSPAVTAPEHVEAGQAAAG